MSWSRRKFGGALTGAAVCALAAFRPRTARAAAQVHTVVITNFRFEPAMLTIKAGDRVEWINRDVVPHTATARDGAWNTGNLSREESSRIAFAASGRTDYFCAYHPHMTAVILVEA